jgi:DNA repair exonuclease SbcCD nuclease subunit
MAVRILHIGDCHLGYLPAWLGELADRRAEDFLRTFARIIDMALEPANAIDMVVIPGDLFEHHVPGDRAVGEAKHRFQQLAEQHIPVIVVPGNHDAISYADSVYRRERFPGITLVMNPQVEKVVELTVRGETVHVYSVAQDLAQGGESIERLERTDEPGLHVAVLHSAVRRNPAWELTAEDFPIRPEVIARSGMHYVALGHFHSYDEFAEGGVPAVYPGSIEGRDFGECGPRYVAIAEVSESGVKIERRECHTRELREVTLDLGETAAASDAAIAERVLEQRSDTLLVRVRLTGPAEFVPDTDKIQERLAGAFFYVEVVDETRLIDGAFVKSLRDEQTIRGLFVRKMLERAESAEARARDTAGLALKLGLDEFMRGGAG